MKIDAGYVFPKVEKSKIELKVRKNPGNNG